MKINNIELEFEVMDADTAEIVEENLEILKETVVPKGSSWSDIIRIQCEATFKFFDSVFGEGTHEEIFEGKVNLRTCVDAIDTFKSEFDREIKEAAEDIKSKLGNNLAGNVQNRAQRRSKR